MGYYTEYSLVVNDGTPSDKHIDALKTIYGGDPLAEECKWYGHEDDMLSLSKMFPSDIFKLSGQGEDSDDSWITYFMNGKKENATIIITVSPPSFIKDNDDNKTTIVDAYTGETI